MPGGVTASTAISLATDAPIRTRASADRAVATLATVQHGVVARDQLRALGLTNSAIARRIETGRLHRLRRGVYAVGHPAVGRRGQWLAAVLACGPGARLSHASAAALQEIWRADGAVTHVTVPGPGRRSGPALSVHRASDLGPGEVDTHLGIPVTSPARTIVDLAATATGERMVERLLDRAEALQIGDVPPSRPRIPVTAAHGGSSGRSSRTRPARRSPAATSRSSCSRSAGPRDCRPRG
jgi:predicted transcriptional regulator of viral defense system